MSNIEMVRLFKSKLSVPTEGGSTTNDTFIKREVYALSYLPLYSLWLQSWNSMEICLLNGNKK